MRPGVVAKWTSKWTAFRLSRVSRRGPCVAYPHTRSAGSRSGDPARTKNWLIISWIPRFKFTKMGKYLKIKVIQICARVLLRNGQANGQLFVSAGSLAEDPALRILIPGAQGPVPETLRGQRIG